MEVLLVMFKSDGARRDFKVTKNRVVVGRKTDCDLRIPLSSVSRHHCELTIDEDEKQVAMRDLGSSNGTYHNNERVQEAVLSAGDAIKVGPVVFTVVIDGQPTEVEPVHTVLADRDQSGGMMNTSEPPPDSALITADADDSADAVVPLIDDDDDNDVSPTVDIDDDDPIAALQRMADAEAGSGDETNEAGDAQVEVEADESAVDILPLDDDADGSGIDISPIDDDDADERQG